MAYAPTGDKGEEEKVEFYRKLERICSRILDFKLSPCPVCNMFSFG